MDIAPRPDRAIADLRALADLTGGPGGARRLCWTAEWESARGFRRERRGGLPVGVDVDEAGNLWARLEGARPETVVIGSHIDSVPNGGWLDGALGVLGALEVLRTIAEAGTPPCSVSLIDFADEEGARFGRSLFGSSWLSGSITPDDVRDSFLAASRFALAARDGAVRHQGVATVGSAECIPGVATVIPGVTTLLLDQRHLDAGELAAMLAEAKASAEEAAAAEQCTAEWERIWRIEPIPFDPDLIAAARAACQAIGGTDHALPSGPLHDAAEMARLVPTVMLFSSSTNGISHAKEEDTPIEHLELAIRAYAQTVGHAIDLVAAG